MKRIALFAHGGFGGPGGGIPFLTGLASRLAEKFDVSVYAPHGGDRAAGPPSCGNARLVRLPVSTTSPLPLKVAALWRTASLDHRRAPFDLVHGIWAIPSGTLAVLFGKRHRIPSVAGLHGAETASLRGIGYGNMRREPYRSLTRWTCRNAGSVIVLSAHQRDALRVWGIHRDDVVVIPPGAEPAFLAGQPRPFPSAGTLHILHVGNLTEVKDQETLLRAFAAISRARDARLRIVGADHLGGKVQRFASALGINARVEFAGFVPHGTMGDQYAWAHLLMQTSLHEAGGVAVSEAAAARVVVCGTATGILADLADRCAVAVPSGDHATLARSVIGLLSDPDRFMALQDRASAWARGNSAEKAARLVAEAYDRLLAR